MSQYKVMVEGEERMNFSANFSEASDPIMLDGNSTPFQVADARHSTWRAAQILNDWCRTEGGEAWGEDEKIVIECEEQCHCEKEPCKIWICCMVPGSNCPCQSS